MMKGKQFIPILCFAVLMLGWAQMILSEEFSPLYFRNGTP